MKIIILIFISLAANAIEFTEIQTAIDNEQYDKALTLAYQIPVSSTDFIKLDYVKAYAALSHEKLDDAEKYIKSAIKLSPDAKTYNIAAVIFGMQTEHVSIFSKLGYIKKAKKYMQKAHQLEPNNSEYLLNLLEFNIHAPGIAGGDTDAVEPLLKKLAVLDNNLAILTRVQFIAGEDDEKTAMTFLNKHIQQQPDNISFIYAKAELFNSMEKYDETVKYYQMVIDSKPSKEVDIKNRISSLYSLGKLASEEERYLEQGKQAFITYLALDDVGDGAEKEWAFYRLGLIYKHLNQEKLAAEAFKNALAMQTDEKLKKRIKKEL